MRTALTLTAIPCSLYPAISACVMITPGTIPRITRMTIMRKRRLLKNFFGLLICYAWEVISHAPFGVYIFRLTGICLDLLTETADMYVHGPYISRIFISPYDIQKVLSAVYFVGIENQKFKQIELFGGKIDLFSRDKYSPALTVSFRSPVSIVFAFSFSSLSFRARRMIALIRLLLPEY